MHNSYWILDIGFFFVQTIERSIGRRLNGDLTSVGYTFDSRSSNDMYFTIDEDSGTDGTGNGRRRTDIETKLPEVMLGLKFGILGTTEDIECAEDRKESNSAEIRFGFEVRFISCNGWITI